MEQRPNDLTRHKVTPAGLHNVIRVIATELSPDRPSKVTTIARRHHAGRPRPPHWRGHVRHVSGVGQAAT